MTFLIDGYNLMHAVGLANSVMPAAQFERGRVRLLDWLADGARGRATLRVVFDALNAPSPSLESLHRGVRVRFAFGQTADDVIEELIETEPRPKLLSVVSNDSRVREAARRGGCGHLSCEAFTDWLLAEDQGPDDPRPPEEDKPEPTARDVAELLAVFTTPKRKP